MSTQQSNGSLDNGCPTNSVPSPLPGIPDGISWVAIPGQNASTRWMVNCCDPYPVHLVDKCWLWCEVDPDVADGASDSVVAGGFDACLTANGRDLDKSNGLLYHQKSAATTRRVSLLHSVVVALATSLVVVGVTSVV
ncbi:hypothetical protein B0I37DRAFT_24477 [Chaetomium sp. MPI-CAGE-AT-0009]|nr:hypothetical protein B0I37DRAFT_24477 [Chaetomium sp. MPI-CAGE-AT-0009]